MIGPTETNRDRIVTAGVVLTLLGIVGLMVVIVFQGTIGGAVPLLGGLALNAAIVGPALIARRFGPRLLAKLPRWLGW